MFESNFWLGLAVIVGCMSLPIIAILLYIIACNTSEPPVVNVNVESDILGSKNKDNDDEEEDPADWWKKQ